MSNLDRFVRNVQNEIEFFTNVETGESGLSVTGLAILCGVSHQAVSKLLSDLATKSPSKWLEAWVGIDQNLATSKASKHGGRVRVLKDLLCSAVIKHYAFSGNETKNTSPLHSAGAVSAASSNNTAPTRTNPNSNSSPPARGPLALGQIMRYKNIFLDFSLSQIRRSR